MSSHVIQLPHCTSSSN